jgi:hypothetical protein
VRARLHFSFALLILLTAPAIPAAAQDAASAKTFLESVYQHYQHGGKGIDLGGPHAGEYFHSSLLTLVRADAKANGPENVGVIDSDPICGCQDWDGIWDLKIDINVESPQRAVAEVSFAVFAPKDRPKDPLTRLQITLVPERGQWRIYNVVDESDPKAPFDLRKELERDIASLRKAPK